MRTESGAAPEPSSKDAPSSAERPSTEFVKGLRDINRYRFLGLMLAPRQDDSDGLELTPMRAAEVRRM